MASPHDNILEGGTVGQSVGGTPMGLIYQQLKIITVILKQVYGINDSDSEFLAQAQPVLNPPQTNNPQNL